MGGLDTAIAERMLTVQCGKQFPRTENGEYISLLDECGGHTRDYHFHERLSCLYSESGQHSAKIGEGLDGKGLYGKWEDYSTQTVPLLDVCGGHFGLTPDSNGKKIYHYHVQNKAPFTIGCFGPAFDGSGNMQLVALAACRTLYASVTAQGGALACDGAAETLTTPEGTVSYDPWCPCYDANGSNVGNAEFPVWSDASATTCTDANCATTFTPGPPPTTPTPATTPTPDTTGSTTITLQAGWSWISLNCNSDNMLTSNLSVSVAWSNGDIIKWQTGFTQYYAGSGWFPDATLDVNQMYAVKVQSAKTFTITGTPVALPSTMPVQQGWTWISMPHTIPVPVAGSTFGFAAEAADLLKSQTAFTTYYVVAGQTPAWFGHIDDMQPGLGYKLKAGQAGTITWRAA